MPTVREFLALWLAAWSLTASAQEAVPLTVEHGLCTFVLPAGRADEKYSLIIGSLACEGGPFAVRVQASRTQEPSAFPREIQSANPEWSRRINDWRLYLERVRDQPPAEMVTALRPIEEREFRLAAVVSDPSPQRTSRLAAVGRFCQVYVNRDLPAAADTVAEIVRLFDDEVYPQALQLLGRAADIDGDGRFTILLTDLPQRLGGYVWHQDFDRQGTGNGCDLMVLNTALQPGPQLRALLTHEYVHAVAYSAAQGLVDLPRREEDWLNEAVAHVAEEALGNGWTNLDYRVAAYRQAPERYPLVAADHYQAGLWRCPGHRGAGYLFLNHCVQRHGPDLLRRLVRTPLVGLANLEVATGEAFPDLFRAWAVAQAPSSRGHDLALTGGTVDLQLASTAMGHVQLHSPTSATKVTVSAAPQARLQVSLVKLPAGTPRLGIQAVTEAGGVRLVVASHDADVTLQSVCWCPLVPRGRSELHHDDARTWFPTTGLAAGESRLSALASMSVSDQPIVFKVEATTDAGLAVTGWCVLEAPLVGWSGP